jgi:hypothetical protein
MEQCNCAFCGSDMTEAIARLAFAKARDEKARGKAYKGSVVNCVHCSAVHVVHNGKLNMVTGDMWGELFSPNVLEELSEALCAVTIHRASSRSRMDEDDLDGWDYLIAVRARQNMEQRNDGLA